MLSSNLERTLDNLLERKEIEPEQEASGDQVEQQAEVEPEVTWDDVEDEWFEFGTDFLIF